MKQLKIKPRQSTRMKRISREVLTYLRGIAARGGAAKTPAKVAASRANIGAINARRKAKAGTEPAIS
jgi:hypothetical protein